MIKFKKSNVYLTRGDSAYITIEVENYTPTDDDVVRCQIRSCPNGGQVILSSVAEMTSEDPLQYVWCIRPEDTEGLTPGAYYWDAQVETPTAGGTDIFSFIPVSEFVVMDEVTEVDNG